MKLKTNVKIDFNSDLFERKKDFFEAEITAFGVTEFQNITMNGQYFYSVKGEKINLKTFNVIIKKDDFNAYLDKFSSSGVQSMDVIENIFYFMLKEEMAKEFNLDINTIDIVEAVVIK